MLTNSISIGSTYIITSSDPVGRVPVGEENASLRTSSIKPVEQLPESGKIQARPGENQLADESLAQSYSNASSPEDDESKTEARLEKEQLERDQRVIAQLSARDREVRAHEQAHMAVGGQYAGAAQFQYERGPDGVNYAVGGEVPIDVSKEATPEQTLRKAQVVRRAALAPAEPSPQDRRVAAQASRMEAEARQEISVEQRVEAAERKEQVEESEENSPQANYVTGSQSDQVETLDTTSRTTESQPSAPVQPIANLQITSRLNESISNAIYSTSRQGSILDQVV